MIWYHTFPFEFSFLLSFSFLEISSWEDFDMCYKLNFSLLMILFGVFFERNFTLGSKRVQRKFYWLFGIEKHGHISFRVLIVWFSERLTPATNFNDFQHLSLFPFLFFYCPIFCWDFPLWAFNLTDSLLFLLFPNSFEEKKSKLSVRNLHLIA